MQLFLKLFDPALGHLPFMIESAISGGGTGFLFATSIEPEIIQSVVCLVAILMIYQLIGSKRSTKVLSHYPTMFKDAASPVSILVFKASHLVEHTKIFVRNSVFAEHDVASAGDTPSGGVSRSAKVSGMGKSTPTGPASAREVRRGCEPPKMTETYPTSHFAKWASDLHRGTNVAILIYRRDLAIVYSWMLWTVQPSLLSHRNYIIPQGGM